MGTAKQNDIDCLDVLPGINSFVINIREKTILNEKQTSHFREHLCSFDENKFCQESQPYGNLAVQKGLENRHCKPNAEHCPPGKLVGGSSLMGKDPGTMSRSQNAGYFNQTIPGTDAQKINHLGDLSDTQHTIEKAKALKQLADGTRASKSKTVDNRTEWKAAPITSAATSRLATVVPSTDHFSPIGDEKERKYTIKQGLADHNAISKTGCNMTAESRSKSQQCALQESDQTISLKPSTKETTNILLKHDEVMNILPDLGSLEHSFENAKVTNNVGDTVLKPSSFNQTRNDTADSTGDRRLSTADMPATRGDQFCVVNGNVTRRITDLKQDPPDNSEDYTSLAKSQPQTSRTMNVPKAAMDQTGKKDGDVKTVDGGKLFRTTVTWNQDNKSRHVRKPLSFIEESASNKMLENTESDLYVQIETVRIDVDKAEISLLGKHGPSTLSSDTMRMILPEDYRWQEYECLRKLHAELAEKSETDFAPAFGKLLSLHHIEGAAVDVILLPSLFPNTSERKFWESWRLSSFSLLPDLAVFAIRLAQSGFYYDEEMDDITCFSCGVSKRRWEEGDKPSMKHLQLSADCGHANFRDDRNVSLSSYPFLQGSDPRSQETQSNGIVGDHQRAVIAQQGATDADNVSPLVTDSPAATIYVQSEGHQQGGVPAITALATSIAALSTTKGVSSSANRLLTDKPFLLPPPAGRHEAILRHQLYAAHNAGTAAPQESLHALASRTSERVDVASATSQVPLTSNTAAEGEIRRYPIQPDQAPHAIPNQGRPLPGDNDHQTDDECTDGSAATGDVGEASALNMRRAASPDNAPFNTRLATFVYWPSTGLPKAKLLALSGFYYMGTGDSVRCFYCGVTLRNWRENDDPWLTHVRFRFSCDYVSEIKGDAYVQETLVKIAKGQAASNAAEAPSNCQASAAVTFTSVNPPSSNASDQYPVSEAGQPVAVSRSAVNLSPTNTSPTDRACEPCSSVQGNRETNSATTAGRSSTPREPTQAISGNAGRSTTGSPNQAPRSNEARSGGRVSPQIRRDSSEQPSADAASNVSASTKSKSSAASSSDTSEGGNGSKKSKGKKGAFSIATKSNILNGGSNGASSLQDELEADSEPSGASSGTQKIPSPVLQQAARQSVTIGRQSLSSRTSVSTEHPTTAHGNARIMQNGDEHSYVRELQQTNQELRRRITCRRCGNSSVDTIFLPCGHLCTCESCAALIRYCCICNERIRGTAHVYME